MDSDFILESPSNFDHLLAASSDSALGFQLLGLKNIDGFEETNDDPNVNVIDWIRQKLSDLSLPYAIDVKEHTFLEADAFIRFKNTNLSKTVWAAEESFCYSKCPK